MSVSRLRSQIYIPEELIVNILKRLPAKSLLRFMCVSKLWYSLIKNPNFISSHFNHHRNEGPKYLIYRVKKDDYSVDDDDEYRVYADTDNFDKYLEFKNPENHYIVGCCDGIICYASYRDKPIVLWNSSLRKSLEIKVPHCTVTVSNESDDDSDDEYSKKYIFWFGFDVASNDYKVLWAGYSMDDDSVTTSFGVYIYSLKERSWRCVDTSFVFCDSQGYEIGQRGEYLNGEIHWVARTLELEREMPEWILTFNLADETFNFFNLPSEIEYVEQGVDHMTREEFFSVDLLFDQVDLMTVKRGSRNCLVVSHEDLTSLNLWVLEDDGFEVFWSKEFWSNKNWVVKILNFKTNGDMVVRLQCGIVISLDYWSDGFKVVSSEKMDYVGNYIENLVFL